MTENRSATDIFRLLADDTRVDILRAVAVAQYELEQVGAGAAELAFSEIYEHVDVENTSKLSYHLERVDEQFGFVPRRLVTGENQEALVGSGL